MGTRAGGLLAPLLRMAPVAGELFHQPQSATAAVSLTLQGSLVVRAFELVPPF